jgi:diaminopropionate ammonia-lyase
VSVASLLSGALRQHTQRITIACASAGNHGRAVAWGAQLFGAHCVVFLYQGVTAARRSAIEQLGATVDSTAPNYDEAVRRCAAAAERNGWHIVSDTAYPGYTEIPRTIMRGYTLIAQEALEQLGDERPTHVLVQAGVGGFAAAMISYLGGALSARRPAFITVEPRDAACLQASLAAGHLVTLPKVSSIMGGLNCGEVSLVAWEILQHSVDRAFSIPDELTIMAMRRLAQPLPGEPHICAGESGAAGFAALLADPGPLGAQAASARVLLFVTEGATDPEAWERYTGLTLQQVAQ